MRAADHRFSVAPMMDGTDRHCRYFHRLLTKRARLYTEMIVADAIVRGDAERHLAFDPSEHPVALQLGGSDAKRLADAAKAGEDFGYDEANLNVGCPSDRVQSGAFGACLMRTPTLVADCVAAMRAAVKIPVTVKCRIGVDDQDPNESLFGFVDEVARTGCDVFIVHARKAWLDGLSPKENREIPPLDYDIVKRLKRERPGLTIILNGGVASLDEAQGHLEAVDGVMLGRAAYNEPMMLADVDERIFGEKPRAIAPEEAARAMIPYVRRMARQGVRSHHVTRHMLGLFHGRPGARAWRRALSEYGASAGPDTLERALAMIDAAPVAAG
ncbi:MAG: tRNA dihydrouridine(20/20a) synthase DusA [Parvularculaceae bacterium]